MNLLARIVSRRVRQLEAALDAQRAQTLTWHAHWRRVDAAQQATVRDLGTVGDDLARARADRDRLGLDLADCRAAKARVTAERDAARRLADRLNARTADPDTRYPVNSAPYEDALTVAQRRAALAEANCVRLENQLAAAEGRPAAVVR